MKVKEIVTDKVKCPRRIAIYVMYDKDGMVDGFRKHFLRELRKEVNHILVVVNGTLAPESREELSLLANDFFVRENTGLLAYGWIEGIAHIGWDVLDTYDELLLLNDSFFGPFFPLSEFFDALEKSTADFYGATKNFEEKTYTSIADRPMKHGHFMGSISYFYVIRERLLHSKEFHTYWSQKPVIKEDWDTYFFSEISFYQYVLDAGFRIEAYQNDELKGYFFDNLTHNMRKLIEGNHIPFSRQRPFCTDLKHQSLQIGYGKDPREALEYIEKSTSYDVNLIWDYILRTKNLTDIYNQLQLEYVIPRNVVEKVYTYAKPIAAIVHIYYLDQVEVLADYCVNFPENTDFYITTTEKTVEAAICEAFNTRGLHFECQIRPNVGVAMSTLWITYADVVLKGNYEYICYFHDKKSPYSHFAIQGEQFATRCYQNLFGTKEVTRNIINLFEENPRLGIVGPPMVYHGDYFMAANRGNQGNYNKTLALANRLGLHVNIDPEKVTTSAYGDMFWFRSKALTKAIGYGFTYDDFDMHYELDFTMLHAIERIYGFAAQDSGYYYADVINSDNARSDLNNYRYMLEQLVLTLCKNGIGFGNYESLLYAVSKCKVSESQSFRNTLRRFLQKLINKPATHSFGMFLLVTYRRLFKRSKKA